MKKAHEVVIPEDGVVDVKTLKELYEHALKSTTWYASTYARNSEQLREKLRRKGYRDEPLTVVRKEGSKTSFDIMGKVLREMKKLDLLDDHHYALTYARNRLEQGYGLSRIRSELLRKKVDEDTLLDVMEELETEQEASEEEVSEVLLRQVEAYRKSSSYLQEEDLFKKKQKLKARFVQRGFSFGEVQAALDLLDIEEEDA